MAAILCRSASAHEFFAPGGKERTGRNDERVGLLLDKGGKAVVQFALGAGLENMKLLAERARGVFQILQLVRSGFGSTSAAIAVACGSSSRSSPNRFASNATVQKLTPVALPPGRLKLATSPSFTGSEPVKKTIGMIEVAFFAAIAGGVFPTITATRRCISSAAKADRWS